MISRENIEELLYDCLIEQEHLLVEFMNISDKDREKVITKELLFVKGIILNIIKFLDSE